MDLKQNKYHFIHLTASLVCVALLWLTACKTASPVGEYKSSPSRMAPLIHLDADGTGYYTWWTDIKMINKGSWKISGDTVYFHDQSLLHPKDQTFTIKGKYLINQKGIKYKKLNWFQRQTVYRGR